MKDSLSFLIILEFVAPFAILSILLLVVFFKRNKKSKRGLRFLLEGVQGTDDSYKQTLTEFLKKVGIQEEEIEPLLQEFTKNRRAFFKILLTALTSKDQGMLESVGGGFNNFTENYHQLDLNASATSIEETESEEKQSTPETDDSPLRAYKRENKRLKAEVHVSVSALNSLFKEYSSMFGEVPENKQEMSVQEILEAMEKFTKGEFKPADITSDLPPELSQASENDSKPEVDEESDSIEVSEVEVGDEVENIANSNEPDEEKHKEDSNDSSDSNNNEAEAKEPEWDEAFEEAGVKMESEEKTDEVTEEDSPETQLEENSIDESQQNESKESEDPKSEEPGWDEAFEEAGIDKPENEDENPKE